MRHYVLTRSAFGPAWSREANERRLAITRAVTARLLAAQTAPAWTWVVLLDERDPFLKDRLALYRASAPAFIPIIRGEVEDEPSRVAAADYTAPWRAQLGPADDKILMTRLDDDDGFSPDGLARYQIAARLIRQRAILMMPVGIRVWAGRYSVVRHDKNAMHTLVTPPGDSLCVYDYGHIQSHRAARVVTIGGLPGWLWVRHKDTLSGWREAKRPIDDRIRHLFPVDWPALTEAWR